MTQPSGPASAPSREPQAQTPPHASLPLVLLVDDQPARLLTYESVLQGVGVTCVRALSGEEALGRLLKQSFALILLDVSMPGMDGFETARAIREHPRYERTPIIFVTGVHLTQLDFLRGYEVGAIDYISVPLVPEILRSKVALLVELYKRRRQLEELNRALESSRAELEHSRHPQGLNEATRYQALLQNPFAMMALLQAKRDAAGVIVDFEYLDANERTSAVLGRAHRQIVGNTVSHLLPSDQAGEFIRRGALVLEERRPHQYQMGPTPSRTAICLYAVGDDAIVSVGIDLAELAPQGPRSAALAMPPAAREWLAPALLRFADTSRSITSPAELAHAAAQIIGETLKVSRCGYGTIDPVAETITVERDWNAPGIESLAGVLHFRDYGSYIDDLKRGDTVVCPDARSDVRTQKNAERLETLNARAFVNMPIVENGAFVALLYLNHADVRQWTDEELAFIREIAERTRVAVERRSHEQAMAADLKITTLLRDLATREVSSNGVDGLFEEILAAAITIAGADAGTLQLLDESTQELYFAATHGLDPALVAHFTRVNATSISPCGIALASGKRSFVHYEAPARDDPDGTLRLHHDHGLHSGQSTPLVSRSGRALGMISTHWKARAAIAERELRFLDLLSRQTADLIERAQTEQALRLSAEQLRDADRRKDEFIAMLAHELRNPLVPIRTSIELLKKSKGSAAVVDTVRPMMERQVKHIVRLIDDLLDVSRITSGRIALRREAVSLSSLITAAVESNREALTQAELALAVNITRPDLMLSVDATRFTQIIANLLHNAIKFTPPGGHISVTDSLEDAGPDGAWLSIRVTDSGVGIGPELLPRIFEMFAQAGSAGRSRHGGLGIGLALARRLAEMHGGTLQAQSDGANMGSSFVLRIPAPGEVLTKGTVAGDPSILLEGVRVLVVDDTQDVADTLKMLIEAAGGDAQVAYDGAAAIACAAQSKPDVILLDIGMPGVDGYQTCAALRNLLRSSVAIIALTGWGQEEVKRRVKEAGFDAHLTKPADPEALAMLINSVRPRPG